ncbi:FecR family protein [Colwellia asteriadis]|uniref:FecR family protein n=1 Tax=Colwellia asteriadis TaxID=517723 RepID=A0ABN1L9F6_9GAMM
MKNTDISEQALKDKDSIEHINEQASLWLLTLENEPSTQQRQAFEQWLQNNPQHQSAFEKAQHMWEIADALAIDDFAEDLAMLPEKQSLIAKLQQSAHQLFGAFTIKKVQYYAAFSTALLMVSLLVISTGNISTQSLIAQQQSDEQQNLKLANNEWLTDVAEHKTITTADGTVIYLAAKTHLTVSFTEHERNIYLHQGEALFTVAKDKNRPFIVHNNGRTVQAIGTIFNVKESKTLLAVAVLEGIVKVKSQRYVEQSADESPRLIDNSVELNAGETVQVKESGEISAALTMMLSDEMAWQQGRSSYVDTNLANVIFDLKRYSNLNIHIADQAVADMGYTGSIIYDKVDDWLIALPYIFPVEVERYGNTVVIRASKEQ